MKILITAGNTQTLIDRVRCITNIFTGRTGAQIASAAVARGHAVTLLTSHPDAVEPRTAAALTIRAFRTFDDLHDLMAVAIPNGHYDAIVHAAAVSDYHLAGTFAPAPGTEFDAARFVWRSAAAPTLVPATAGKISSRHPELWLRLTPAPKLIDFIREPWGFSGVLVKFKLEVGLERDALLAVAEKSRLQSRADLMVANTLDGRNEEAFIGAGNYQQVARRDLATELLDRIEHLAQTRQA